MFRWSPSFIICCLRLICLNVFTQIKLVESYKLYSCKATSFCTYYFNTNIYCHNRYQMKQFFHVDLSSQLLIRFKCFFTQKLFIWDPNVAIKSINLKDYVLLANRKCNKTQKQKTGLSVSSTNIPLAEMHVQLHSQHAQAAQQADEQHVGSGLQCLPLL